MQAMICSEYFSWEVVSLASSLLGPEKLAAQTVLLTTSSLLYQAPFATSAAASVRLGNLLGVGRPDLARLAARVTIGFGITLGFANSLLLVVNRRWWGRLFSSEAVIVDTVAEILPIVR